MLKTEF